MITLHSHSRRPCDSRDRPLPLRSRSSQSANPPWLRAASLCLALAITALPATAQAENDGDCEVINQPAQSGFDFTESISRWGSQEAFDLNGTDYHVHSISINQLPIFDETNPRERNDLYRWINRVHFNTRPGVIRHQLLFDVNDVITGETLQESERMLRDQAYAADAKLRILKKCSDNLDLEVVTKEVWTLTPEVSFKSKGGDNTGKFGIRDTNFLGTGRQLSLTYKNDPDRSSYEFAYKDPNINGTRMLIDAGVANSSDGHRYFAHAGLPFYALDSRFSWDSSVESIDEILSQYHLGHKVTQVNHENRAAELSLGFSDGREDHKFIKRFSGGIRYEKHRYLQGPDRPPPALFPDDLSLAYPFVRFETIEDEYAVAYNISQIYRTEDLHVGKHFISTLGYDPGGDSNVIFNGRYSDTLMFKPKHLLQVSADWDGRWNRDSGKWRDTVLHINLDYHRGQTENRTLFMGIEATKAWGLNPSRQVSLGGDNGLRGFDSHILNGDGSVVFTAEQRLFTDYHILQLLRVGFAAFYDAGKIYGDPDPRTSGIFQDVGFGLRLAPSKSQKGQVVHMDLAWPVGSKIQDSRSMEFVLEVKQSF